MSALSRQVEGQHYKNQKIQPIELAYVLGQTPAFCKVAKYATRIKDDPVQQLHKALHCIELDEELKDYHHLYGKIQDTDLVYKLLSIFTEDENLHACLMAMHLGDYTQAIFYMQDMITTAEAIKGKEGRYD
tara:strand:+ start:2536 stop:2928 length:393 start_codon:yes stop_codon:yes gene_type:complete